MANGIVNLLISDKRVGNGMSTLASDAAKANTTFGFASKSVDDFGKGLKMIAPDLSSFSGIFSNVIRGGLWQVGAQAAVTAFKWMRESAAKAAKDIAEVSGGLQSRENINRRSFSKTAQGSQRFGCPK